MIRISFGIYNTEEEVDEFLRLLPEIIQQTKDEIAELVAEDMDPYPPEY